MINDEVDINPEDPDSAVFLPTDKRKFSHTNSWDVLEHDRAVAAFEEREQHRIRTRQNTEKKTWYGWREVHVLECTCSYCGNGYDKGMKPGLNIPKGWKHFNAWWCWFKPGPDWSRIYYRCTPLSFLRPIQLCWRKLRQRLLSL